MLGMGKCSVRNGEVQCYEWGSAMIGIEKWNVINMEVKCL